MALAAARPLGAQPRCAPVPQGLSAWFTFDEPLFRPLRVPGLVGPAVRFNGKDQYVEVPLSTPGLDMGEGDFTIEFWIRTTDSETTRNVVDKRDYGPLGYLIFIYKGHPGFQVPDGDGEHRAIDMAANVADGKWHHLAGVVRRLPPQPFLLYVDSGRQPQKSGTNAPLVNLDVPLPLWLGRHHANKRVQSTEAYFHGEIDELSFYSRALTAAEVQSIFRAGSAGKCRPGR